MRTLLCFLLGGMISAFAGAAAGGDSLSLEQALEIARKNNPRVAAWTHRIAADEALLQGDEEYANPQLAVDVEDFLGSGAARGVDSMQVTAALSQEVQLGGKPGARRKAKEARREVSVREFQVEKQNLEAEVATAFLEVLAGQGRLANAREMVALASSTVATFEYQVEAGRAAPMEVNKAKIILSLASLAEEQADRALRAGRQRLATICGEEEIFFGEVEGSLSAIRPLVEFDDLLGGVSDHPAMQLRAAETARYEAMTDLARANRVPDITFSLGYRWINAVEASAVVAGVAMPIPLVNRNQGPIAAAGELEGLAREDSRGKRLDLVTELSETYQLLAMERNRARVLEEDVVPMVKETFNAVEEGYRLGRFGYLDLLDAQRTLFEVKDQALEAMIAYQRTSVHLCRIAALDLPDELFAVPMRAPTEGDDEP